MLLTNLFESSYGAAAGVETIRQLLHAVKNKKDIDLKVGPEMVPVTYGDARYLLQYFKANRQGGDATAEFFGDANWIDSMLTKREHSMSSDRLKDMDSERFKEDTIDEAEFEITYKDPQFTGTKTHTVKAVNAKGAEQKFLSFGNPHKVLDVKKKEKVDEADMPLPKDFVPEPVVAQTIKDLGPGLDPMANGFYELAYGKLLANYLAQNTPEIKKKFNVNWNLAWASQMRELYSRKYGGYMKTPVKEDPTPKRRIMDFDNHSRYWSGNGEYQDAYGDLYDQLVPKQGKADTVEGELLRAVGRIIYRHGNDGDNFSNSSYEWIEKHVGKFDHLDDMADKVVLYVLNKKGDYTPNNVDWVMDIADYGPGEHEKDWEQVGCQNCGGTGEIEYENDDGEEEYEECDSCDGNGWIEQTTESKKIDEILPALAGLAGRAVAGGLASSAIKKKMEEDYKGWKYGEDIEQYDDVAKKFHYAEKDGKKVDMDWSPYVTPSEEQFKTWVDLGMPTREAVKGIGPLSPEDLEQLMKTKLGTQARLAQEGKPTDIELDVLKYTDEQVAKAIAIARGSQGNMTGATKRIEAMADGLSSHSDVAKVLKIANEAKKDDITGKMDVKTKMALKKQQAKSAGITKGDPVAALAMGLEKDVDRLDKENDQEQADIASQELVDRYHSQELDDLKKSIMSLLKK